VEFLTWWSVAPTGVKNGFAAGYFDYLRGGQFAPPMTGFLSAFSSR
jgi:hypothetical protein